KFPDFNKALDWNELNRLADHLTSLAATRLRDGVLDGVLRGRETEIRQDAVLQVLGYYLRDELARMGGQPTAGSVWVPERSLAYALRINKLRLVRKLAREAHRTIPVDERNGGCCQHPQEMSSAQWPEESLKEMIREAIMIAARTGRISPQNACVA